MVSANLRGGLGALVLGSLTLLCSGCAAQQSTLTGATTTPEPSPVRASPSAPDTTPRATPSVTFLRSGGIAGFSDRLILSPDGQVVLTDGRREDTFTCTVDERTARRVGFAVMAANSSTVRPGARVPRQPIPDLITYTVIAEGRRYDMPDRYAPDPGPDAAVGSVFRLMHAIFESAGKARARAAASSGAPDPLPCSP